MSLFKTFISDSNIYSAIYAVDSYIAEPNLLSPQDRTMLFRLKDKFDFSGAVGTMMDACRERLDSILKDENDMFSVKVYFKLKKYDEEEEKVKFRPLHTASLTDQICMAALLIPLMFDDSEGKRRLSELSRLLPHNFYGNIPCERVESIFEHWRTKYKEYVDRVNYRCKEYSKTRQYDAEISLDLQDFFPSINPEYIFNFIWNRLSPKYSRVSEVSDINENDGEPNDKDCLRRAISKLLYFKIDRENLRGWEDVYYPGLEIKEDESLFMNRGIAQGLPQSYFFGNLCMIDVADKMRQNTHLSESKAYFYVDDSVVFAKNIDDESFRELLVELNESVISMTLDRTGVSALHPIPEAYENFQKRIEYEIRFHKGDKSHYCEIEDSTGGMAGLHLVQPESGRGWTRDSLDEIDDNVSWKKLDAIGNCVKNEIDRIKSLRDEAGTKTRGKYETRLKWLNRYRKYYSFRKLLLQFKLEGFTKKRIRDYNKRFLTKVPGVVTVGKRDDKNKEKDSLNEEKINQIFDSFEEDIFQSETQLLIKEMPVTERAKFCKKVQKFESEIAKFNSEDPRNDEYLYYKQITQSLLDTTPVIIDDYASLVNLVLAGFQLDNPRLFLAAIKKGGDFNSKDSFWRKLPCLRKIVKFGNGSSLIQPCFPEYTGFIFYNSEEYRRRILNCCASIACKITVNDTYALVKRDLKAVSYLELRILAMLRNRDFKCSDFFGFVNSLDTGDINENMAIDLGILEALGIFRQKVRDPFKIDSLIQTHRIVKSLWHNGSKFLNAYTLHNQEHAVTLVKNVTKLINNIDFLNIKANDYFLLFNACYLHDISMVIHPNVRSFNDSNHKAECIISNWLSKILEINKEIDESFGESSFDPDKVHKIRKKVGQHIIESFNDVFDFFEDKLRSNHPSDSATCIRKWHDGLLSYIEPEALSAIAKVSESHGWDATDVYNLKSDAKEDLISLKYMMILIRLADLLDLANDRVDYFLLMENRTQMNLASRFHWISHLVTEKFELDVDYNGTDSNLSIEPGHKILENIFVNIYLNVDMMLPIPLNKKVCRHVSPEIKTCRLNRIPKDTKTYHCLDFRFPCETDECNSPLKKTLKNEDNGQRQCPFICAWMTIKHEWLFNEFNKLAQYLNAANSELFESSVTVRFIYDNARTLDPVLRDDVMEYLKSKHPTKDVF